MELLKDKNLFFKEEEENINQFYNMYQKKQKEIENTARNTFQNSIGPSGIQINIVNIDDFKEYIYSWLTGTFTHSITNGIISPFYYAFYYVELYACFFYFNYYYQSHYNFIPVPSYSPNYYKNPVISEVPIFYLLDYNIGYYFNKISWKDHCKNVKKTLTFIKENSLVLSEEGKYIENDMEILTGLFHKFMEIINSSNKVTVDELQNFEKEITEKLENKEYASYTINSLKRNVSYLDKYFLYIIDKNKNIEQNIENLLTKNKNVEEEIKTLSEENKTLSEENKKTKDFYLTVSGSVMALISLVTGNISLVNKDIAVQHIFIFNGSILVAILIFSYLFFSLYTKDTKTYPKKFIDTVGLTIISFFISLLIYFLWIV